MCEGRDEQKRFELDNVLGVDGWARFPAMPIVKIEREDGAPAWWKDDEEASQSFLKAMPPRRTKAKKA